MGRSYRNYDKDILQAQLRHVIWDDIWHLDNPDICWSFILKAMEVELTVMCPLKSRKVRSSNEPWMNNGILEATQQTGHVLCHQFNSCISDVILV